MTVVPTWRLRAAFARALSEMYGQEVPAYTTLVEVSSEVNAGVLRRDGSAAERLGTIGRVTAERHGAIRVGTPQELRQVAQVFAALGMYPVGFYDLRDTASSSIPVVSTAFRPIEPAELALNPFRVFTSILTPDDRRFFDAGLQEELEAFLARRRLFPPELLALAARAERERELPAEEAKRFLKLAVAAFKLSAEPVDRSWYRRLEAVSSVAADIGGVTSTHVNHLTPRVLDIDELYRRMSERGIEMIDEIQGPPRWDGPDVLLRQTSFRALSESRRFRLPDGRVEHGSLSVRFGEVEARGIALTPAGRDLYDVMLSEVDARLTTDRGPAGVDARSATDHRPAGAHARAATGASRQDVAREVWAERLPGSESELAKQGLGYFRYRLLDRPADGRKPPVDVAGLIDGGWAGVEPIVYEDFLPRSAAGIFQSNLAGNGSRDTAATGSGRNAHWMQDMLERTVHEPADLYAAQSQESLRHVLTRLQETT
ncbi:2-oxoadipate dioxygenase/decarboxylase family protein [Nonomuraea insulae]|uniref:2-oxoadipate dioxygenase/decarboxylase n=1 Tax=Nonomuraea insulae TaxID=1616787 RepID=A0ABW1DCT6_9ACTN